MTPQEELDQALAELAAANAELAAAQADVAAAKKAKAAKRSASVKKRMTRQVHHTELRAGCSGTGERFTGPEKLRVNHTPVVTKHVNPMDRPEAPEYVGLECLFEFDIKNGLIYSDSWQRCKCAGCAEIRRG